MTLKFQILLSIILPTILVMGGVGAAGFQQTALLVPLAVTSMLGLVGWFYFILQKKLFTQWKILGQGIEEWEKGNYTYRSLILEADEVGKLTLTCNRMAHALETALDKKQSHQEEVAKLTLELETSKWFQTGKSALNECMQGEQDLVELGQSVLQQLAIFCNAQMGALYGLSEKSQSLQLLCTYAYPKTESLPEVKFGEGLIGQAALDQQILLVQDIPENYLEIGSSFGGAKPQNILIVPILTGGGLKGILELGSFHVFTETQIDFLRQSQENIGLGMYAAEARVRMQVLLTQFEIQHDEIQETNEELQAQQEKLHQVNEELEEKAEELLRQQEELRQANEELEQARQQIEEKAQALETTNRYKSEFLSNMSHELRTPLNSLLIFSQLLAENKTSNLSEKQVKMSQNIYASGSELLALINDVLDLAKVESGKVELLIEDIALQDLIQYAQRNFQHLAEKKGVILQLQVEENCPVLIHSDRQKLEQILKNLLSNAFKFTEIGSVIFRIFHPDKDLSLFPELDPGEIIALAVSDTGIGIPQEKQNLIFEAFLQASDSTSRQYGGTGLGLSISRELAHLIGGEIGLQSEEGRGSTFTLYLPVKHEAGYSDQRQPQSPGISVPAVEHESVVVACERESESLFLNQIQTGLPAEQQRSLEGIHDQEGLLQGKKILVVDDDMRNVYAVLDVLEDRGMQTLTAVNGKEALRTLEKHPEVDLVLMDIMMPVMDGYEAMQEIRKQKTFKHLPIISLTAKAMKGDQEKCIEAGANDYLTKPIEIPKLLSLMRVWLYQ